MSSSHWTRTVRQSSSSRRPWPARLAPGTLCVGDGALRYRALLEEAGAVVPPADDPRHAPRAGALAGLASGGAPEPVYVRRPDAEPQVA